MAIFKAIDKSSKKVGGSKGVLDYVGRKANQTVGILCSDNKASTLSLTAK